MSVDRYLQTKLIDRRNGINPEGIRKRFSEIYDWRLLGFIDSVLGSRGDSVITLEVLSAPFQVLEQPSSFYLKFCSGNMECLVSTSPLTKMAG